jgi:hypothetical protein
MPEVVPYVIWSWVPITLLLFARFPARRAAVASLVGGWLLLPTARFPDATASFDFPYWIMPACLPSDQWTTKARIISLSLLLGIVAFDSGSFRRIRPSPLDLPMVAWCLAPLASGLVNGVGWMAALADAGYQALSWGMPYLAGRLYFAEPVGIETLALGFVWGGLACLPLTVAEFVASPFLYRMLYGFHPYESQGVRRYIGSRPLLFFEDGNQLGIVLAVSAMVAAWLWRSGRLERLGQMPGGLVAALLMAQSFLVQSVGAAFLLVAGMATLEAVRRVDRTWPIAAGLALVLALAGARAANLIDAKALAMATGSGRALVTASGKLDRQSLGWRLRVEERGTRLALRHPWLGRGLWDWWAVGTPGERPWGLTVLTLGQFGVLGWVCLSGVFLVPLGAFLSLGPPRFWSSTRAVPAALTGALAIVGFDSLLNPAAPLAVVAAAGSLVGFYRHAIESRLWVARLQAAGR